MKQTFRTFAAVLMLMLSMVFSSNACAQDGRAILDKAAASLKKGGVEVQFKATTYKGLSPQGSSQGTLKYSGSKFAVSTSEAEVWFDGKSQWTILKSSNEVNLTEPTAQEIQQINPMSFVNLYRQKSKYTVKDVTYGGQASKEVTVVPNKKTAFRQLIVIVSNNQVRNIRMLDAKGQWVQFKINSLKTGQHFSADVFKFDEKKFPQVEIIDLR